MSITIHHQPQLVTPGYNPAIVVLSSTNQAEAGHQFICDIFSASTSSRVSRIKLPANPDGYAVFDIHRILENYVTYDLDETATGFTDSSNSSYDYDLQLGEEYKYYWQFTDNHFYIPNSNYLGLTSTTNQHYFIVGDRVNVQQDAGFTYASYNGVHTVKAVLDNYEIALDTPYLGSTPAEPGNVIYADQKKTIFSGLESISGLTANNSAFSHLDYIDYDVDDYNMTGGTAGKFFTNMPSEYFMRTDNRAWVNYYASSGNTVRTAVINTYDAAGNIEGVYFHNTNTPVNYRNFGIGPWNLSHATISPSGGTGSSLPIIKSSTTKYEMYFIDNALASISETLTISLDTTCTKYDNVQLIFKDRKGSMMPANFQLVSKESINIERKEFKKPTGEYNAGSGTWGYNAKDRGRTIYNTDITRSFEANSNWVNETTAAFYEELFSSSEVYWNDEGVIKPIIITNNFYPIPKAINEKLFNVKVNFQLAYRDEING